MNWIRRTLATAVAVTIVYLLKPAIAFQAPLTHAEFDLNGRYPQLATSPEYGLWRSAHAIGSWREGSLNGGQRHVAIVAADNASVFGLLIQWGVSGNHVILRSEEQAVTPQNRPGALRPLVQQALPDNEQITDIFPMVSLTAGPMVVTWMAETRTPAAFRTYRLRRDASQQFLLDKLTDTKRVKSSTFGKHADDGEGQQGGYDSLATNELHHPELWQALALKALADAGNPTDTRARARALYEEVTARTNYAYAGEQSAFVLADTLSAQSTYGACDEQAVMLISWLRSVGIRARLKFAFLGTNATWPHAFLEFQDGAEWRHADPIYAFDDKLTYRNHNHYGMTILDADWPLDSRSTVDFNGYKDEPDDSMLAPYPDAKHSSMPEADFRLHPRVPGEHRLIYSCDALPCGG